MEAIPEEVRSIVLNPPKNPIKPELGEVTLNRGSFKVAEKLASKGKWSQAAAHYRHFFYNPYDPNKTVAGINGVLQMAINVGDFDKAGSLTEDDAFLDDYPNLDSSPKEQFMAKKAWYKEMVGDPAEALDILSSIDSLIPSEPLYWHVNHFKGRAKLLEGLKSYNGVNFINDALTHFLYDLRHAQEAEAPLNQGFNYIWLSRCQVALGQIEGAWRDAGTAEEMLTQGNANLGEVYQLKGELFSREGDILDSVDWYARAYSELKGTQHKTAAAEAAWGLTKALSAQGEGELSAKWANFALVTYPYVTTRLYI